ncbi:protein translocase subunit SecF [Pseudanabaena sp. PCC 6802]|uniref:protein translocase subunit SecF n=1 Tax=Pseudanabaena sp. PCC 6802 TaxID=118173 RepID=UPI00034AC8A2|nr:protein translocase subunit SecF [Pseudanabaena sp. PCC 6802]
MKLDVIKYRHIYLWASTLAILVGLAAMLFSWQQTGLPLKPAIDFTGGNRLTVGLVCESQGNCGPPIDISVVRRVMTEQGFADSVIQLADQEGQKGRGVSVQTGALDELKSAQLRASLEKALSQYGKIDPKRSQTTKVGPAVGKELLNNGLLALLLSFAGIAIYLAVRFQPDYAFFAIVALLHDVLVTVGVFAILGLTIGVEVDSLFIVAMLTIIGFSVNDTVVIYDRIRENLKLIGDKYSFNELVNISVNQTLARSINTTLTALLSLVAIFLFGGATLKYFALALIIGFASGAYSSIFNASILLAWWRNRRNKPTDKALLEADAQ